MLVPILWTITAVIAWTAVIIWVRWLKRGVGH